MSRKKVVAYIMAAVLGISSVQIALVTNIYAETNVTSGQNQSEQEIGGSIDETTEETENNEIIENDTSEVNIEAPNETDEDTKSMEESGELESEDKGTADEWVGENSDSLEVITGMDEEGNIYEIGLNNEPVTEADSSLFKSNTAQIVNFNIKSSSETTNYSEAGTGEAGYVCGAYGADAAYLGNENGKIKFMISGVIGLVNPSEVQVLNITSSQSLSYYEVSNGRLIHRITTNVGKNGYASNLDNGPAPSYLSSGVKYYSYDGHFFYTYDNFGVMLNDYSNGNRTHSVNPNTPFYNYFQYLPFRSRTSYSGGELTSMINNRVSQTSKMRNLGGTYEEKQNLYGTNGLLVAGVSANESAWGDSKIAQQKNNIFGMNAVDSSPGESANYYSNVETCIKDFTESYLSKQYLNANNWKYYGGFLGNKASGLNVKYASDPYWGEKAAAIAWVLDKNSGNKDAGQYTIGIKDTINTNHTNLNIRTESSTSSASVYRTGTQSNHAFIILESQPINKFYKIQSDPVLNSGRTSIANGSGAYDYNKMYLYASSDYIWIVNEGLIQPEEKLIYSAHIQDIGWQSEKTGGMTAGTIGQGKAMEGLTVRLENYSNLGISYRAHVAELGWQDWVSDGALAGTVGNSKAIEAMILQLTGSDADKYDVYYRVYSDNLGWLGWAKNGEKAGTQGYGYSMQAIQIVVQAKDKSAPGSTENCFVFKGPDTSIPVVMYQTHVSKIGWQDNRVDSMIAGTTGQSLSIEALMVNVKGVKGLGVKYKAHVSKDGWQEETNDGGLAGTTGQSKKVEAIQITLTGENAKLYDIYYRAHVSHVGWLGWAKNGESAGSQGYGYGMEAMQVMVQKKGTEQPGSTDNCFLINEPLPTLTYSAHVASIGWQNVLQNGEIAGTTGQKKAMEALKINVRGNSNLHINYQAHVAKVGWQKEVTDGMVAGTVGLSRQMEAVQISLTGVDSGKYDIYYRAHVSNIGWLGWSKNGEKAGSQGYGYAMEALQIVLKKKGEQAPGPIGNSFVK